MTEIEQLIECARKCVEKYNFDENRDLFWEMVHVNNVFKCTKHKNLVDFYFDDFQNPLFSENWVGAPNVREGCRRGYENIFINFLEKYDLPENLNNEIKRILVLANLEK